MPIEFHCAHCQKFLSTSLDKAGRQAKCPGCGEMLVVPQHSEGAAAADESDDHYEEDLPPSRSEPLNCLMCGASNPPTARACQSCGEPLLKAVHNPPSHALEPGSILTEGWEIFAKHAGVLIGAYLVFFLSLLVAAIPTVAVGVFLAIMAEQQKEPSVVLLVLLIPCLLLSVGMVLYLLPGQTMLYLGVARGEDVSVGTLFAGGRYFLKSAICTILFGLMVSLGLMACVLPGIFLALRYWPYLFVIVDEDPPGLECFHRAAQIASPHWMASFVIGLVGWLCNAGAQTVCPFLQIAIQPLASLWFTVGYLQMTGQPTVSTTRSRLAQDGDLA